ncbi:MAG: hypothetical protein V4714_04850, partial [Bacteroidota bacterium]
MRQPNVVLKEIQQLDALLNGSRELQYRFPADVTLSASIDQHQQRKLGLLHELEESLRHFDRHSVRFVFTNATETVALETVTTNLQRFKLLIDKAYARITQDRKTHLPLFFNTIYSGSFGMLLSTPFEEELFHREYDATFDFVIGTIHHIVSQGDAGIGQYIKDTMKDDKQLIKRFANFFRSLADTRKSIRIGWYSPNQAGRIVELDYHQADRLYKLFQEQERFEEEKMQLYGTIKGISLIRFYIEFKQDLHSKQFIKAHFAESLAEEVKKGMDRHVLAQFNIRSELNEVTEEVVKRYELLSLNIQPNTLELFSPRAMNN